MGKEGRPELKTTQENKKGSAQTITQKFAQAIPTGVTNLANKTTWRPAEIMDTIGLA